MKRKTRNILIATGVICTLILGGFGYGIYRVYSFFSNIHALANREIPDELKEPRVVTGGDFLSKSEFFKFEPASLLETIGKARLETDEKKRQRVSLAMTRQRTGGFDDIAVVSGEVIAVGRFGAYFLQPDGVLNRSVQFEPTVTKVKIGPYVQDTYQSDVDNLRILRLEKDKVGFISHGSVQGVRIFNDDGDQIWELGREDLDLSILTDDAKKREERMDRSSYVLEATAGDLDGDGVAEYIVATKSKGTTVFDRTGVEKWTRPDEYASERLFVIDADGDAKNDILVLGHNSGFWNGADGRMIRNVKADDSASFLLINDVPGNKKTVEFCDLNELKLTCEAEDSTDTFTAPAPLSEIKLKTPRKTEIPGSPELSFEHTGDRTYIENGVRVALRKDQPTYIAVIGSFTGFDRAHLYVYDEKGKLVYHELLPQNAESIAVLPKTDGTEDILVGGQNTIWRFSIK